MTRKDITFLAIVLVVVSGCVILWQVLPIAPAELRPYILLRTLEWTGPEAFSQWDATLGGFFAIPSDPRFTTFDSWSWKDSTLVRNSVIELPRGLDVTPLAEKKFAFTPTAVLPRDPSESKSIWPLVLSSFDSPKEYIKKWDTPKEWSVSKIGGSQNGKFAAICMKGPPDFRDTRIQIGLLNVATQELRWVYDYRGRGINGLSGYPITVSDDGKSIAIMGWNHSIAMVNTETEEMQEFKRPEGASVMQYCIFSPDGSILHVADSGGGIFVLNAQTGEVISATTKGKSIYGQRVSCFAVSPDGAWLAAGTGPAGQVFLFDVKNPENKPIMLPHGEGTTLIVSFSPDSKYLASVAGGLIKIWTVNP